MANVHKDFCGALGDGVRANASKLPVKIVRRFPCVIPAKAGIQSLRTALYKPWIPAFAGMTQGHFACEYQGFSIIRCVCTDDGILFLKRGYGPAVCASSWPACDTTTQVVNTTTFANNIRVLAQFLAVTGIL